MHNLMFALCGRTHGKYLKSTAENAVLFCAFVNKAGRSAIVSEFGLTVSGEYDKMKEIGKTGVMPGIIPRQKNEKMQHSAAVSFC